MKKFWLVSALFVGFGLYVYLFRYRTTGHPTPIITATAPSGPSSTQTVPPQTLPTAATYKDGTYIGPSVNAFYGNVQVEAIISGGKLTNIVFLDHPQDRSTSVAINNQAMPILREEAIQAQNANVDGASGASDTSAAFIASLSAALKQAS